MSFGMRLSDEAKRAMVAQRKAGATWKFIAEKYGISSPENARVITTRFEHKGYAYPEYYRKPEKKERECGCKYICDYCYGIAPGPLQFARDAVYLFVGDVDG